MINFVPLVYPELSQILWAYQLLFVGTIDKEHNAI